MKKILFTKIFLASLLISITPFTSAVAYQISYLVEGKITYIENMNDYFSIGDEYAAEVFYDSEAIDTRGDFETGQYDISDMSLEIGSFSTSSSNGFITIRYQIPNGTQEYRVDSYQWDLSFDGYEMYKIEMGLTDHQGTYFQDDTLPATPPDLGEFESRFIYMPFTYDDGSGINWGYSVTASIDSIIITSDAPVPEPTTMLLLGTGLIGLAGARRKMKS